MKGLQERFLLSAPKEEIVEGIVEEGNVVGGMKGVNGTKATKGKKGTKTEKKGSWWRRW
jgi:hypothetical protein